jgi:hypothetical protein
VYTVVGYSRAGYSPQEIARELLPRLSLEQLRATLRYYAEYPDEIDQILAEGGAEAAKARLYRSLGPPRRYGDERSRRHNGGADRAAVSQL